MRITNQNQASVPSDPNTDAAPALRNDPAVPTSPLSSIPVQPNSLMPSFELLSLTAALQQVPPVREEVIAETTRRLAAGQLHSSAATEQTARAILGL